MSQCLASLRYTHLRRWFYDHRSASSRLAPIGGPIPAGGQIGGQRHQVAAWAMMTGTTDRPARGQRRSSRPNPSRWPDRLAAAPGRSLGAITGTTDRPAYQTSKRAVPTPTTAGTAPLLALRPVACRWAAFNRDSGNQGRLNCATLPPLAKRTALPIASNFASIFETSPRMKSSKSATAPTALRSSTSIESARASKLISALASST